MTVVETIARIRFEHFQNGKGIKRIARELGIARDTVRKILRSGATEFVYRREVQPQRKLGAWIETLTAILEAEDKLPRREIPSAEGPRGFHLRGLAGRRRADSRTRRRRLHRCQAQSHPDRRDRYGKDPPGDRDRRRGHPRQSARPLLQSRRSRQSTRTGKGRRKERPHRRGLAASRPNRHRRTRLSAVQPVWRAIAV